jgi:hypothetical protein
VKKRRMKREERRMPSVGMAGGVERGLSGKE